MVCLTLGFVLNAFELKLFDSLSVAKKLHENVHLASFTIAMLVTNGAIFSCSILDPVMTTNKFWTTKQLTFLELTRKSISNTVANQREKRKIYLPGRWETFSERSLTSYGSLCLIIR